MLTVGDTYQGLAYDCGSNKGYCNKFPKDSVTNQEIFVWLTKWILVTARNSFVLIFIYLSLRENRFAIMACTFERFNHLWGKTMGCKP